jgi:hypothetical protein
LSDSKIQLENYVGATNYSFALETIVHALQTPESDQDPRRWLGVIAYEFWMLRMLGEATTLELKITTSLPETEARTLLQYQARVVVNALCESRVLHARNICDFCTAPRREQEEKAKREKRQSKRPNDNQQKSRNEIYLENDIKPSDLFKDYYTPDEYSNLLKMIEDVATAYLTDAVPVTVKAADGTSRNEL